MPSQTRPEEYVSPFSARYTSPEMSYLFSPQHKYSTFRKLWVSLAKAEKNLGLSITAQQIKQLEAHVETIDFSTVEKYEKKFQHDVMAHIHAFGDQCPDAKPIIHLGATSTFVTDNTDLIILREAMRLLLSKLVYILKQLAQFAKTHAADPCLAYTHFQPAQPTTVGKRASLWLQDLLLDAIDLERQIDLLPFLGAKGATGTQASFLSLLGDDSQKVIELERQIAADFHFDRILPIAGQTYSRKLDLQVLNALESLATSTHKIATDIRLLAHDGELTESFGETQVGSSAMPYKRNPIYSERICGLSRFVISLSQNPAYTAATQWLERSLDDSSNRRLTIPEAFLGTDSILNLLSHLIGNLKPDPSLTQARLAQHLPHLAMENILMAAVKQGKDRQEVHEQLRKLTGKSLEEIAAKLQISLDAITPESLIGRAPEQVHAFLKQEVDPFLKKHASISAKIPAVEI